MTSRSSTPRNPYLFALCLLLWVGGLIVLTIALLFLQHLGPLVRLLSVTVSILMILAGIGLYRLRRWGVILFGLLALVGSINHLSVTLTRYNNLAGSGALDIIGALLSIFLAILIPIALIYLTLQLWRQAIKTNRTTNKP